MRRKRRGSFLIEQLMVVGIGGALLLVATSLIHHSFRAGKRFKDDFNVSMAQSGLVSSFRSDVQQTIRVNAINPSELKLSLIDGSQVDYAILDNRITRNIRQKNAAQESDTQSSIEQYIVDPGYSVQFANHAGSVQMSFSWIDSQETDDLSRFRDTSVSSRPIAWLLNVSMSGQSDLSELVVPDEEGAGNE